MVPKLLQGVALIYLFIADGCTTKVMFSAFVTIAPSQAGGVVARLVTVVNRLQSAKAFTPNCVTEVGIIMEVRL